MTKSTTLLAAFVIVSALGTSEGWCEDPPTYGGRTLETWIPLIKSDLDPETRFRGMLAVGKLGRVGADRDSAGTGPDGTGSETIALQAIGEAIADEPVPIVRNAGYLAILGYGEPAWPVLAAGFEAADGSNGIDEEERRIVIHATADFFDPVQLSSAESQLAGLPTSAELAPESRLPPKLAASLVTVLADDRADRRDRETAARALGGIFRSHPPAGEAERVRAAAIGLAREAEIDLAVAAIRLLGQMGDHVGSGVGVLTEIAGRNERLVAAGDGAGEGQVVSRPAIAIEALGTLGAAAEEALPELERLMAKDSGRAIYTSGLARQAAQQIRAELARKAAESNAESNPETETAP